MAFLDLQAAQASLQQQVASGAIQQWQADAELNRLRGLNLQQAQQNLQAQGVDPGLAAAEVQRLGALPIDQFAQATMPPAAPNIGTPPTIGGNVSLDQAIGPGVPNFPVNGPVTPPAGGGASGGGGAGAGGGAAGGGGGGGAVAPVNPNSILNPNPALGQAVTNLAGGDQIVSDALKAGMGIAGLGNEYMTPEQGFFYWGSLGRVDDQLSPDVAATLERARIGPIQPYMGQVREGLSGLATNAANVAPELQQMQAERQRQYATSGQVDPVLQEIMARRQAGLEGLTAPELTALREQGSQGINQAMQTAMRQANVSNLMAGRRGNVSGAAIPGITRAQALGQAQLERDILLQNVAERNRRLSEYQDLASTIDVNRFARQQQTLGSLEDLQKQIDAERYGRQRQSLGDLGSFSQAQQQLDLASLQNYQNYLQQARDDVLKRQVFNLGQLGQEKAGQIGLLFGSGQIGQGSSSQKQNYELGMAGIEAQKYYADKILEGMKAQAEAMTPEEPEPGSGGSGGFGGSNTSGGTGGELVTPKRQLERAFTPFTVSPYQTQYSYYKQQG